MESAHEASQVAPLAKEGNPKHAAKSAKQSSSSLQGELDKVTKEHEQAAAKVKELANKKVKLYRELQALEQGESAQADE